MRPMYAGNAQNLLRMRQAGQRPIGPVVVSLTGDLFDLTTLHLYADMPHAGLDWRMLVNLDVWVWANPLVALERLLTVVNDIARVRPHTLFLRFEAAGRVHDVEVGNGLHLPQVADIPAVHRFDLCPTNNTGSKLGAQLCSALKSQTRSEKTL